MTAAYASRLGGWIRLPVGFPNDAWRGAPGPARAGGWGVRSAPSRSPQARIEHITQRVAEEVEGEHGEADRDAGNDRQVRVRLEVARPGAAEHRAPGRRWRQHAQT